MAFTVHHGDCREVMRGMEADSFHAIATDPPYGLSFMGRGWDRGVPGAEFWAEALRVAKPGAHLVAFGGTRTAHRLFCAIEDAGWEIRDSLEWLYGSGFPKPHNLDGEWDGYGTALKPAHEPIVLARKPLDGTVAANVNAHGCGALAIDACRIGIGSEDRARMDSRSGNTANPNAIYGRLPRSRPDGELWKSSDAGRWPANVVLGCACEVEHDAECAVALLDAQSGDETGAHGRSEGTWEQRNMIYGPIAVSSGSVAKDLGGASRFFYTAKASRSEREAGLEHRKRRKVNDGRTKPVDNAYQRAETMRANTHPTVKPVALMRWLVRLIGGKRGSRVLDPFCGSGTTGVACALEGYEFVGIDLDPEYCEIARDRIAADAGLFGAQQGESA